MPSKNRDREDKGIHLGKITGWDPKESGKIKSVLVKLFIADLGEAWSGDRKDMFVKYINSHFACNLLWFLKTLGFHQAEPVFAWSPSGDSL